jgi:hypothetical protein
MRIRALWPKLPAVPAAFLLVLVLLSGAARAAAQQPSLSVTSRPLRFGDVLPGVPITVEPTDPARSGQFDITGPASATIEITFFLPTALEGPGGAKMPIAFGPMSAGYSVSGSISSQLRFDPGVPFRVSLSELGRGSVFIGGALSPSMRQVPGGHGASVSIAIALVGL